MNKLLNRRLGSKMLMWLCIAALLMSVVPLYALSAYNHACYDDFGFTLRTHGVWRETGSVLETAKAAIINTVEMRNTWQGTFSTSVISAMQPAQFDEGLYWMTTALLLTAFLAALWFFLRQTLVERLKVNSTAFWLIFCATAFVSIQFVPDLSEAFYWFNGGVGYTLVWSVMLVRLALWLCFDQAEGRGKQVGLYVLLALTSVFVGGGNYTTPLFACLVDCLLLCYAFHTKRPKRWAQLSLFALLLAAFAFSMTAPGNWVRAGTLGGGMSPIRAIAQAFYFGLGLMGSWFSLPLVALWALAIWQLSPRLRTCSLSFKHPVWATAIAVCLFCAQLTPTLVTGNYIGDGRTQDTYYYTYVLLSCMLALYWTGWAIRRAEAQSVALPKLDAGSLRLGSLLVALVLLAVGCVSYHPPGVESYGPQHMASGSALRSLVSGQAARFDAAMDRRDAEMNDPAQAHVTMRLVEDIPPAFMGEALDSDMQDYVLSLYQEYYAKQSVTMEKGE